MSALFALYCIHALGNKKELLSDWTKCININCSLFCYFFPFLQFFFSIDNQLMIIMIIMKIMIPLALRRRSLWYQLNNLHYWSQAKRYIFHSCAWMICFLVRFYSWMVLLLIKNRLPVIIKSNLVTKKNLVTKSINMHAREIILGQRKLAWLFVIWS